MLSNRRNLMAAAVVLAGGGLAPLVSARGEAPDRPAFAAPVRMEAGDKFMGEGRLYPSPVFHDVDGDGLADIVIGDLVGRLTVAPRLKGEGPPRFGPETLVKAADGKDLDFDNW
jgi:hypothetical protein